MADIFISYSHIDAAERAITIGKILHDEMGWDIWQDVNNLRANKEYDEEIQQGIRDCSIFLMLYSKAYELSQYCAREFSYLCS